MRVRSLPLSALLAVGLFLLHTSSSAVVLSEKGQLAAEETLDVTEVNIYELPEEKVTSNKTTDIFEEENKQENSSSSEESSSNDHPKHKKSQSSESEEDSSSEEASYKKVIRKRSLDSKQDSINTIGEGSNQTSTKDASGSEKDSTHPIDSLPSNADAGSESSTASNELTVITDVTTEKLSSEPVTSSETDSSSGILSEVTNENNLEPTETEAYELGSTTEAELETTTEIRSETPSESASNTEDESVTSTTETSNISSSEDNDDETSITINSPTTTTESPKPEENKEQTFIDATMLRVNKLSDQIRLVLQQYRKDQVVVIPGQSFFPEPLMLQDFQESFSIGTMTFKNMKVFGLSNFTVEHINTDVDRMQVYILLHMKRLVVLGNYTLRTFFSRAAGPFNVTLLDVDSEGVAEIETATEGHLVATDSVMDMFTKDMRLDFKNLGFMGSMFQGMVSTVGDALFNSLKPQILERVNLVIRTDVNKKLKEFSVKFINKVAPVDLAFSEGRKYVRTHGYDPYNVGDHTFILGGLVHVNITQFWVEGLSRFYRVGNLSLSMDSGVIQIGVHVMTHKLTGRCAWSGQTFGIIKSGKTNFTIDHLQVRALVNQSLDIRKKPQLEDLDLELGWVKVTMDSPMTLNLMIEGIINAFPRLIRHIIVDTLEQPLKEKIQEILDKVNVESFVNDNLPRLDNLGL